MNELGKADLNAIIEQIGTPVSVFAGQKAYDALKEIPEEDRDGVFRENGRVCIFTDGKLYCTEDSQNAEDIMRLLLILSRRTDNSIPKTLEDTFRCLLAGKIDEDEAKDLIRRFAIRTEGCYRLAVFNIDEDRHGNAYRQLMEIFPLEKHDHPVKMTGREFVLVHEIDKNETEDDFAEFCLALCDTAESEADIRLYAGITEAVASPARFADAYRQGQETIRIALRFNRIGPVWLYNKLILERFLNEIPTSVYEELRAKVMTVEVRKLLTGEMLETVNMFFKCDLNLSDTARQMFIHRNTLMYRLDKIQKVTGLDLRKFYDAVVFRIIMELPKE